MAKTGHSLFEILINGKSHVICSRKAAAIEAAEYLQQQNPHSEVVVKDLQSGELMALYKAVTSRLQ